MDIKNITDYLTSSKDTSQTQSYQYIYDNDKLVRRSTRLQSHANPASTNIPEIASLYSTLPDNAFTRDIQQKIESHIQAYTMTLRKALRQEDSIKAENAKIACIKEIRNIVEKGAVIPLLYNDMHQSDKDLIIPAVIIVVEKFKSDGTFRSSVTGFESKIRRRRGVSWLEMMAGVGRDLLLFLLVPR
jgi:hypothetical protein